MSCCLLIDHCSRNAAARRCGTAYLLAVRRETAARLVTFFVRLTLITTYSCPGIKSMGTGPSDGSTAPQRHPSLAQ